MKKPDYTKYPFRPFSELSDEEKNVFLKNSRDKNPQPEHITVDTIFFEAKIQNDMSIIGFTNKTVEESLSRNPQIALQSYKLISQSEWENMFYPKTDGN